MVVASERSTDSAEQPPAIQGGMPVAQSRPGGQRTRFLIDFVVGAILFVLATVVLLRAAETVPFHGDESEWISAGRYFRYVFLDHDVTSQVWRPSWLNRDQPPLGRYIIGGIVWASGTDPAQVNKTYAWERDYQANLREGRVPEPSILLPVRRTMAIVGALSIVLLFVAGRLVGGTLTGAVAGLAATMSPLLQTYFVQARTEALLALFSTLALVALLLFARRYQATSNIPRIGWVVGPILGLALATKLTAAVAILGACAYGGVAGLVRLPRRLAEAVRLMAWAILTGLLATLVWIVVNPFMWQDPAGRTGSMLTQQQSIMVEQGQQFGNPVEAAFPERLLLMVRRSFVENSTPAFDYGATPGDPPLIRRTFSDLPTLLGVSIELALAAVGFAVLIGRAVAGVRVGERHGPEIALLWWLDAYLIGIAANLSLDWPRYYVPTAFYGALLIGLGADLVVRSAVRWRPGSTRAPILAQPADARLTVAQPAEARPEVAG
jgi:hypothetical protein